MDFYNKEVEKFVSKIKRIEKKWRKKWYGSSVFESNPSKSKKFFITFPIPYVNGSPHIGHSFSFYRADSYARFKRLEGYNVLFPQGFHSTGEPILGAIQRIKNGDEVQIRTFQLYGATKKDIENFVKKGPKFVAKYWMKKWISVLKEAGFSIDWRRTFITAIDPAFSKFIEWQYRTLKKKGYITQGTHPVVWCPHCKSPTGDHDRLKGEGESPIEFTIIKFKLPTGEVLPCATLRPETIYGVTNIWINPDVEYMWVKVNDEVWLLSEYAVKKLQDQLKKIEIIGKVKGNKIVDKKVKNLVTGDEVPVLPATFVDPDMGTGIVMSVPAHAPYDYIALEDLKKTEEGIKLGVDKIKPIQIIEIEGFEEIPAKEICEKMGIKSQEETEKLEKATEELYKKEFHLGVMTKGDFAGKKISEIKDRLIKKYRRKGIFDSVWETTGEVICRCGTKCHVKILENQWFLKYSDEKWKEKAKEAIKRMTFYPEEIRNQFINTVDWLKDKACTRKTGLGTPLPWDKNWIIETLSDSTIYMAFYTISHIIKKYKIKADKLNDKVFDYIYLGKGDVKKISKETGIKESVLKKMRKEFEYFYPIDIRTSGKDLVQNHLIFFIFHHTAIWPKKYWPKAIAVNGFVQITGQKMSKSTGNIVPLIKLLEKYGSDLVRINIISSNEDLNDAEWREENISSFIARISFITNLIKSLNKSKKRKLNDADKYIITRIEEAIEPVRNFYDSMKFRSATQILMYQLYNDMKWYVERVGGLKNINKEIKKSIEKYVKMLSPLLPHISEEWWMMLGGKKFVFENGYPKKGKVYKNVKEKEEFIKRILEDIQEIKKIVKIEPKEIHIIVADEWKFKVAKSVKEKKFDIQKFEKSIRGEVMKYYQKIKSKPIQIIISKKDQYEILESAKKLIEKRFKSKVFVHHAEKTDIPKKSSADVFKPAIYFK